MLAVAVALASCQEQGVEAGKGEAMEKSREIAFVPVGGGQYGWQPREENFGPQVLLIRSKEAWARIAGEFSMSPAQTPPESDARLLAVDYSRQSILVVTLGQRGSASYSIRVERIEAGPPLRVIMSSTAPRPDEMTAGVMTHPFSIVVVNLTSLPEDAVFERDGNVVEMERAVRE